MEWIAEKTCYEEHHWHAGTRLVTIYHFELHNGDETLHMPVITNPYVRRILREENFNVVEMNESRKSVAEQHRYEGHPHSNA